MKERTSVFWSDVILYKLTTHTSARPHIHEYVDITNTPGGSEMKSLKSGCVCRGIQISEELVRKLIQLEHTEGILKELVEYSYKEI